MDKSPTSNQASNMESQSTAILAIRPKNTCGARFLTSPRKRELNKRMMKKKMNNKRAERGRESGHGRARGEGERKEEKKFERKRERDSLGGKKWRGIRR